MRVTGPTSFPIATQRSKLTDDIQADSPLLQGAGFRSSRGATHVIVELSKIAARAREAGSLVDVGALPVDEARDHFVQITALRRLSTQLDKLGVVATRGSETTTSMATLLAWLQKRAGIDQAPVRFDAGERMEGQANLTGELRAIAARVGEISQPEDVSSLSPEAAKARLAQLRTLEKYGGTSGMGAHAVFNGQTTSSLETYMGWLEERGKSADPNKMAISPHELDLKTNVAGAAKASGAKSIEERTALLGKERAELERLSKPDDVDKMTPDEAKARFNQLSALKRIGDTRGMTASAVFGGQQTDSFETYMEWLAERGKDATPGGLARTLSLLDIRA